MLKIILMTDVYGFQQWSIKLHNGKSEALFQYKANLTAIADTLEKLGEHSEVYWVLQGELNTSCSCFVYLHHMTLKATVIIRFIMY